VGGWEDGGMGDARMGSEGNQGRVRRAAVSGLWLWAVSCGCGCGPLAVGRGGIAERVPRESPPHDGREGCEGCGELHMIRRAVRDWGRGSEGL
jgi:hypothetical protein